MKPSLRSRQEPRRVSNSVIIGAMLLSLCVLSIVKARYCATPFGTPSLSSSITSSRPLSIRPCGGEAAPFADVSLLWPCAQARRRTSSRSR